jgi:hypothetical protein
VEPVEAAAVPHQARALGLEHFPIVGTRFCGWRCVLAGDVRLDADVRARITVSGAPLYQ